ncbi:MAG: bacillithiol system redox-active protein YtxJ [Ferruginibacter sp.]
MMDWVPLTGEEQLDLIKHESSLQPQVIFKHSTRCTISSMAKGRLERSSIPTNVKFYYLDLIRYRSLSNKIEQEFMVEHESPQILIIKDGNCIYDESHSGITMDEIEEKVRKFI